MFHMGAIFSTCTLSLYVSHVYIIFHISICSTWVHYVSHWFMGYIVSHGCTMFHMSALCFIGVTLYMGTLYFDGCIMFHMVHYIPRGYIMLHVCAL